jgi:threonine dehydrogenase-like Zn-dependent dehydrogenase
MMQAAVLVAPKRFEIQHVARPDCGPGDVIIKVARCCICGTDVHIFNGQYSADKLPMIPGHEFSGTIDEVGSTVTEFSVGQKAIADINVGCGNCFCCRRNEILNCPSMQQLGIHSNGAFAEYVRVPARLIIGVSDDMPLAVAAPTEPLACVVRSATKTNLRFAESVVVLGLGPIGNLHVLLAHDRINVEPFLKNVLPLADIQQGITEFISNPDLLKVQISM